MGPHPSAAARDAPGRSTSPSPVDVFLSHTHGGRTAGSGGPAVPRGTSPRSQQTVTSSQLGEEWEAADLSNVGQGVSPRNPSTTLSPRLVTSVYGAAGAPAAPAAAPHGAAAGGGDEPHVTWDARVVGGDDAQLGVSDVDDDDDELFTQDPSVVRPSGGTAGNGSAADSLFSEWFQARTGRPPTSVSPSSLLQHVPRVVE